MTNYIGPYELGPGGENEGIYVGDSRVLAETIPDESVDLVFTDPPYAKKYLWCYKWLAQESVRVLKPGGLCVTLCGHFYVLQAAQGMMQHMDYFWLGGMIHRGPHSAICPRQMWASWKPMLWFVKPGAKTIKKWTFDMWTSRSADKRFHTWGQPESHAAYYISRLSLPDEIVWEPFCGGGTVPSACKRLGRQYLAFEIEEEMGEIARERVRTAPMPLFILEPEQKEIPW